MIPDQGRSLGNESGYSINSERVEAQRACGDVGSVNAFIVRSWRHLSEKDVALRCVCCWIIIICDESVGKVKEGITEEDAWHGRSARTALARPTIP